MTLLVGTLTVVVVLLSLLVAGLLRSHGEILRRLHELDAGLDTDLDSGLDGRTRARDVPIDLRVRGDLPRPSGGRATVADLAGPGLGDDAVAISVAGTAPRTLLAFLSSGCTTCAAFWEALATPDTLALPHDVRLVIVTKDPAEESRSALGALAPDGVPLVMSSAAWADYAVPGSPYFVLVDGPARAVRGEGTGVTWDQVRRLLAEATADALIGSGAARAAAVADEATREARIDRELLTAGIAPGHPSLYHPAGSVAEDTP
jgi:hypothetical protein